MPTRKFTEQEVEDLVWDGEITEGEARRWSSTNTSVVTIDDKQYELYYEHGLTEMQENEYEEQEAPEVKKVKETVVIEKWVNV